MRLRSDSSLKPHPSLARLVPPSRLRARSPSRKNDTQSFFYTLRPLRYPKGEGHVRLRYVIKKEKRLVTSRFSIKACFCVCTVTVCFLCANGRFYIFGLLFYFLRNIILLRTHSSSSSSSLYSGDISMSPVMRSIICFTPVLISSSGTG